VKAEDWSVVINHELMKIMTSRSQWQPAAAAAAAAAGSVGGDADCAPLTMLTLRRDADHGESASCSPRSGRRT